MVLFLFVVLSDYKYNKLRYLTLDKKKKEEADGYHLGLFGRRRQKRKTNEPIKLIKSRVRKCQERRYRRSRQKNLFWSMTDVAVLMAFMVNCFFCLFLYIIRWNFVFKTFLLYFWELLAFDSKIWFWFYFDLICFL